MSLWPRRSTLATIPDPRDLVWQRPWLVLDFPCPNCSRPVTEGSHKAFKRDLFGHDLEIIECPRLVGWMLVQSPRDRQ